MRKYFAWLVFLAATAVFPSGGTAEEQPPFFSNKDVEKYRRPTDSQPAEAGKAVKQERKRSDGSAKDKLEQERWCKRASAQKKKIEKAQYDVRKAEKDLARDKEKGQPGSKKNTKTQDRLDRAKHLLALEEKELNDIENEAHRKGVPPGWLRCQFD